MAKGRVGLDVVAAQRQMVGELLETVLQARLEPVGVDLVPFALIRAVGQDEGLGLEETDRELEAIVDIGADVTNICVHHASRRRRGAGGAARRGGGAARAAGRHDRRAAGDLLNVFDRRGDDVAQIEVDGRAFVAAEGERFAQNFRVIAIDGECATLLFGDETFRICVPRQGK